jgi:hypothetical protein
VSEQAMYLRAARSSLDKLTPTYLLAGEAYGLVVSSLDSCPTGQPLYAASYFTERGFVVLERPLFIPTTEDETQREIWGFSWVPGSYGEVAGDSNYEFIHKSLDPEKIDFWIINFYGTSPENDMWPPSVYRSLLAVKGQGVPGDESYGTATSARLLVSLLAFVQQRVLVHTPGHLTRADRRRLGRRPEDVPSISVITLRAAKHHKPEGDATPVDWQYRWLVRGHWRQQWYPSVEEHRLVWVMPHVKGPEDKPFRPPSERVYAVTR